MRHVGYSGYKTVVMDGSRSENGCAQFLPKTTDACKGSFIGITLISHGNYGVFEELGSSVLNSLLLGAGHGVRPDKYVPFSFKKEPAPA